MPPQYAARSPVAVGSPSTLLPGRSPRSGHVTTPNYFDYQAAADVNPPNSGAGVHARKNWATPTTQSQSPAALSNQRKESREFQQQLESLRRQSENGRFSLSRGAIASPKLTNDSAADVDDSRMRDAPPTSDDPGDPMDLLQPPQPMFTAEGSSQHISASPAPIVSQASPSLFSPPPRSPFGTAAPSGANRAETSPTDDRHPRSSLPDGRLGSIVSPHERPSTVPTPSKPEQASLLNIPDLEAILDRHSPEDVLLLDLRVFAAYAKSRIRGALNLCIPTTLLKRSSYNVKRLSETFCNKAADKEKFDTWRDVQVIVVYDAASWTLPEAASCVNILRKFRDEFWHGKMFVLKGGFHAFAAKYPHLVDTAPATAEAPARDPKSHLSIDPPPATAVAGGCTMPADDSAADPFFGSIRQNMDLIGGVGQMPVNRPPQLASMAAARSLPSWLEHASDPSDHGKTVAARFLAIEKAEQSRMQTALSTKPSSSHVQIAGIEKGTKNRYKDILPFDHSRVKLQVTNDGCDYVNASHIKTRRSHKQYIATQAPVPATFHDFWRAVWEQDARVIVMLTAESEGCMVKSHPYWLPDDYRGFKVKSISEKRHMLRRGAAEKRPEITQKRPSATRRHSSKPSLSKSHSRPRPEPSRSSSSSIVVPMYAAVKSPDGTQAKPEPFVTVRKLTLSSSDSPFAPLREITQLHYTLWPDLGTPAAAADVLALVDLANALNAPHVQPYEPCPAEGIPPLVVHCSAGCGRTGTFCAIDTVIDMLKQQRQLQQAGGRGGQDGNDEIMMDMSGEDEEGKEDDQDLIAECVAEFRKQRLSMVQTLRQFCLCYEGVLEWIARQGDQNLEI